MGNWRIVIDGHGSHHNGLQTDANTMAATFVGELQAAGHEVSAATFDLNFGMSAENLMDAVPVVSGSSEDVVQTSPADYLAGQDERQPT